MTGWIEFALALTAFGTSHFLPRLWGLRRRLIAALGRRVYFSLYGILSLVLLAWVIGAAGRAPHVMLWPQMPWMRWVPTLAMPVVFVLAAAGVGLRHPHTLGAQRGAVFDPADPGVAALSRHPLLVALALWAGAHVVANGDLAHVVLFGGFAALSLAAIPLFERSARRVEGPAFFERTALVSLRPFARPDWRQRNLAGLGLRAGAGLLLWGVALHLHAVLFGVSPFPM